MVSKKSRKDKPGWKLFNEYPITEYKCGLKAGDRVVLRKDLVILDDKGNPTGEIHSRGEAWVVLPGSNLSPNVVWFHQADGKRHTWNDDATIPEWFEVSGRNEG